MTATDTRPVDVPADIGAVEDSQNDDLPIDETVLRRREALRCSSLLRPYR